MSRTSLDRLATTDLVEPISYQQFLATDFENPHVEWVNGRAVSMAPITDEHQNIGGFLISLLRAFVTEKKLGVLLYDPFQMKTAPDLPGRAPDILFLSNVHRKRLKKTYVDGPADLVVEIISAGSRRLDRSEKFHEYEVGGVREYWLIDPKRKQAEFFFLDNTKHFQPVSVGVDGMFSSIVIPGVWIRTDWLWQSPLPSELSIMREWGLI